MRLFTIIIFSLILCLPCSAAIHKWVDDQGNVIFSDTPPLNQKTELITQKPINTYRSYGGNEEEQESAYVETNQSPAAPSYNKLSIIQPPDGSSLLSNSGHVKIVLQLNPPLDRNAGHKINVKIDGRIITTSSSTSITIDNVDRGTHILTVDITDSNGTLLKSSSSTFHLRRSSSR